MTFNAEIFIAQQDEPLSSVLRAFYGGDDDALREFIETQKLECPFLNDLGDKRQNRYLRLVAHASIEKIFSAYSISRMEGKFPEFELSFIADIKPKIEELGLPLGSQQDLLYTITSERAPGWIDCLTNLGFKSACMSGEGCALILTSDRFLNLDSPDLELYELPGSIPKEFYINLDVIRSPSPPLSDFLSNTPPEVLEEIFGAEAPPEEWNARQINSFLTLQAEGSGLIPTLAKILSEEFLPPDEARVKKWNQLLMATQKKQGSQEQLVLKYISEGKLLQKLLGGTIVDHVASNVKMQVNPLRKNKVEVDSVYGIIDREKPGIVLVEAKDKPTISITQLYSLYETYRLRLPPSWSLHLVAALMNEGKESLSIDLVEVNFNDNHLGDISLCLNSYSKKTHYRWTIDYLRSNT